jgi:hypothetical protein
MLNSGEKKFALCATKNNNILTLVLSEKKILNETKNHNPPLQVKWSVPNTIILKRSRFGTPHLATLNIDTGDFVMDRL